MQKNKLYFQHILQAIESIERYLNDPRFIPFQNDDILTDALARQLGIIGEASTRITQKFREKHPELPYKKMIGMRNFLIHEYEKTKRKIVLDTCRKNLPPLKKDIQKILNEFE